jgi:hypothetical protein
MGRLNACPATRPKNRHVSSKILHTLALIHESLLVGSRLEATLTATAIPTHRNDCYQTIMALHSHMNNLFDLIDIQRQTEPTYELSNATLYVIDTAIYNDLLQRCTYYGTSIYRALNTSAKTDKQRELLTDLLYKLDRFIRFKILPFATSPLSKYLSQFKYPKRSNTVSFYQYISQERVLESPIISALRNNYYFPLIDEADLDLIQEEHIIMTPLSPSQEIIQPTTMDATASVNQVNNLFHSINKDEDGIIDEDDDLLTDSGAPTDQTKTKEYRMRFTIFRKKGYAPSSMSQVKIFQDFLSTIKSIDNDVQILPIDNKEINAISSDRQIRQIDASTIHHFFKAQNPTHQTITGEFHLSAKKPYKELMAHPDMKTWFAYHCYGHKYSEHQVSPMIRIGFLTRVRTITYRDGLRDYIMKHPLWNTPQYPSFHFTLHFRTLKTRHPKPMQTMVLNINAEKIHMDTACSLFQELFDGNRRDSSPNEIPYTFIPTTGNFFTDSDIPKIIHDNEQHTTSYGVILITGLNHLDTKVGLQNNTCTTIHTILNSLPLGKGNNSTTLFSQIEQQPNTDWVVCVFTTNNKEYVHNRLHLIEQEIKRILKDEEIERTFIDTFKISGMKTPVSSKSQPRLRAQSVSTSAVTHTKQILSNLANPPAKRALSNIDHNSYQTYAQSLHLTHYEATNQAPTNTHIPKSNHTNTNLEDRMTNMETQFKNTDARLTQIESTCVDLKSMCSNTLEVLQRLTAHHEAVAYQRNDDFHHKHIRPNENTVTCDTPMTCVAAARP